LLHGIGHAYIKDALHQDLDGEQMGVDVLQIGNGLLHGVELAGIGGSTGCSRSQRRIRLAVGFLELFQSTTCQRAERLQCRPTQLLLLTQGGVLAD